MNNVIYSNMNRVPKCHIEYLSLIASDGLTDEMKCYAEHVMQQF
jgi:hypothetical protein